MKHLLTLTFLCLLASLTHAQWNNNPASPGSAVCTANSDDYGKISITDGTDGSIVIFTSRYYDSATQHGYSRVQAQRIAATGALLWNTATNPKAISDTGSIYLDHAIPDGAGGAFITYTNYKNDNGDVFVQHINSSGNISWPIAGINISNNTARNNDEARLCLDGSGGVIVSWTSDIYDNVSNTTTYSQVFAQRLNSTGAIQWTAGGVQLSTATGIRVLSDIVTDGAGGAIVFFMDTRNSQYFPGANIDYPNVDIYAQKITAAGNRAWTDNGTSVVTEPNIQNAQAYGNSNVAVSDGVGGAILVYGDYRNGNTDTEDLFTQRINSAGVKQWTSNGVQVCTAVGDQYVNKVLSNGANGMVAFWEDERTSTTRLFAQQINSSGTILWTINGVRISGSTDTLRSSSDAKPDGLGNYIASWNTPNKIKAQKINNAGTIQWATDGVDVYSPVVNYNLYEAQVTISDNNKAIITWAEDRADAFQTNIYARKVEVNGVLPLTILTYTATLQNNQVLNQWQTTNEVNVSHINVQRSVDGTNFSTVGKVNAKGNGVYTYTDYQLPTASTMYYRLQIVDKDGSITYSKVVAVNINASLQALNIFPNPVQQQLIAQITSAKQEVVTLKITDIQGKILYQASKTLVQGNNQLKVAVGQFTKGNYIVQIIGTTTLQQQFVKE